MTQAEQFEAEMGEIWDPNNLFTDWFNANDRAKFHGASETGNHIRQFDNDWYEWEFPDQSKVWILKDGSGTVNNLP